MDRDGSGVSALLGLDGFVVCAQLLEESTGEWWRAVERAEDRAWCERCGVRALSPARSPSSSTVPNTMESGVQGLRLT